MGLNKLSGKNSPYLFFIKFLGCFFILYGFFPFYWGITGKGGKIYSAFLDNHFNIIKGLTGFLTGAAKGVLESLNYTVHQSNYHTLRISYSGGISINPTCLGWAVMSFWVAFVFANNGGWKHKVKWMIAGVASVCILNITRIALIALAAHLRLKTIILLDHHQTFNIFSYGCIFILMYLYIRVQKKYEGTKLKRKKEKKSLSWV